MAEPTPRKPTYNVGSKLERFDPVVSRAALSLHERQAPVAARGVTFRIPLLWD
jgi:hypothetical protein